MVVALESPTLFAERSSASKLQSRELKPLARLAGSHVHRSPYSAPELGVVLSISRADTEVDGVLQAAQHGARTEPK